MPPDRGSQSKRRRQRGDLEITCEEKDLVGDKETPTFFELLLNRLTAIVAAWIT